MAEHSFDVAIVGAGPAGCSCALQLKKSGLKVALIDRALFPRDKICGDAIPSTAFRVLESIDPELSSSFNQFQKKVLVNGCRIVSPANHIVNVRFVKTGYASARIDFDQFLLESVHRQNQVKIFTGVDIDDILVSGSGVRIAAKNNEVINCKIVVGCDGAHSVVSKKLTSVQLDRRHHIGAVRAYYKSVDATQQDELEIHLVKGYMPGYFWIFPLQNGICNVGYGMISEHISKRKINLKKSLEEIISSNENFKNRFANAEQIGEISGFGLPLGSRKVKVSGERFLLAGDAASLINPATGEGIGNAMRSGKLAAEQVISCFQQDNFSEAFNKQYDKALYKKLWKDLQLQYWFQRVAGEREWLIDFAMKRISGNEKIKNYLSRFF